MTFSSATVTIGRPTKKSDYDRLLANTQYDKSTFETHSGTTSIHIPVTISISAATGGSDGDMWLKREA